MKASCSAAIVLPLDRVLVIVTLTCVSAAQAELITYSILTPAGAHEAWLSDVAGSQQVGVINVSPGPAHAGFWSGTPNSFVDLNPAGARESMAISTSGAQQVGWAAFPSGGHEVLHASLWSGSAASFVDLNPPGASTSSAWGASGAQQFGFAQIAGVVHAGIWSGTAASFVDLHPAGAIHSQLNWGDTVHQAGRVTVSGHQNHAALWSGTPQSFVDLNPSGAQSIAYGGSGGQQVGVVDYVGSGDSGHEHAALWSGTAGSFIDLNPPGALMSVAEAASGPVQVGYALLQTDSATHAALWLGSADSFVDLHQALGPIYTASEATGVTMAENVAYVSGYVYNGASHHADAILWKVAVPDSTAGIPAVACVAIGFAQFFLRRPGRRGSSLRVWNSYPAGEPPRNARG